MNITVRKAQHQDIDAVDEAYTELLLHERKHGAYTVWQLGVYPTQETAEKGFADDSLYVAVVEGEICGSIIINQCQPEEYKTVNWAVPARSEEVLVIHLLCVRPSRSGLGVGRALVQYAIASAETLGCRAVRLDTAHSAQCHPHVRLPHTWDSAGRKRSAAGYPSCRSRSRP